MEELSRWQPVRPLGAGAFGQVHLAWDNAERRWVAVKHFTGQDDLGLLRFVIESRIRVSHPHLVSTVSFRLVDDQAWLVTELARGGSLRPLLNRGPLPAGWVIEVVDQVLDALTALHGAGVIHRDVKPANILLRDAGMSPPHVLVADFGIAAWRAVSMTGVGASIGTLGYLAPEYLDGTQPSPRTDLFAVGVLAAELLSGRRLVHHSNAVTDLPAHWSDQIPVPAGIPARLAELIRRMADPDPRRRHADCHEALVALRVVSPQGTRPDLTAVEAADLLAALPHHDSPPPPVPRTPPPPVHSSNPPVPQPVAPVHSPDPPVKPRVRRRFPRVIAALAAVVVLATTGFVVWQSIGTDPPGGPGTGQQSKSDPVVAWKPSPIEPCSRVDIGRVRAGNQRCQRVSGTAQAWVAAPPAGFPAKSNPNGPLAGEACTKPGTTDFDPTGTPVLCRDDKWVSSG
ncbi:MAG: serine/threonine-protein kinase [Kibdelosporangium sp.]